MSTIQPFLLLCLFVGTNTDEALPQADPYEFSSIEHKKQVLQQSRLEQDDLGPPAIHFAARNGLHNVLQILLNTGSNPEKQDSYGVKPLWLAVGQGHPKVIEMLVDYGASPAMSMAPAHGTQVDSSRFLLYAEHMAGQDSMPHKKALQVLHTAQEEAAELDVLERTKHGPTKEEHVAARQAAAATSTAHEKAVSDLLLSADRDGDDQLSMEEVVGQLGGMVDSGAQTPAMFEEIFHRCDTDGDGQLKRTELHLLMGVLSPAAGPPSATPKKKKKHKERRMSNQEAIAMMHGKKEAAKVSQQLEDSVNRNIPPGQPRYKVEKTEQRIVHDSTIKPGEVRFTPPKGWKQVPPPGPKQPDPPQQPGQNIAHGSSDEVVTVRLGANSKDDDDEDHDEL
mmetsp:Transcript_56676/g.93711  ORF Transcript_56676/g.93711 Transcript_56676/m.93711 type:complete len:394 (+) Transcript_56676:75-1256(+)|eukprot:CAMPEP_0119314714 /NCGR_PEP_ID=MMETSP1333-20130426/33756_1 /TAXON_ID=418940 /ORGANISM="Scyphosphaera apsteinii, Strain RCC1455" /LENGTH=393 /DNA_ID=CAMNT_0007319887 /DNA_START=64 /DNA_END=1245 /DNA_ORIENTATION=+